MIDIDEFAQRAVSDPVSATRDVAMIRALAKRSRRRRAVSLTTAAALCIAALFALVAANSPGGLKIRTDNPIRPRSTTAVTTGGRVHLTAAGLVDQLQHGGFHVSEDGRAPGYPLTPSVRLLCVGRTQVRVYSYADEASREASSEGISADGSTIRTANSGSSITEVIEEWVGPPHFFAAGRIVVLVLQDDAHLLDALGHILGPTISPHAVGSRALAPCSR